jgi:DNA-binding Lrp family transcriptional regulator
MDQLIPLLLRNARASNDDLAKGLNTTTEAVAAEIARLEADGVLLGYHAIVDPQKVPGTGVTAAIEVKITPERGGGFDRLAQRISKFAEVQSCYLMSGGYDLLVIVEGATLQDVAMFISEKLSTIKGVISTASRFRLKAYKENGVALSKELGPERLAVSP